MAAWWRLSRADGAGDGWQHGVGESHRYHAICLCICVVRNNVFMQKFALHLLLEIVKFNLLITKHYKQKKKDMCLPERKETYLTHLAWLSQRDCMPVMAGACVRHQ